jgi:putative ABC transport system permease protein
MLYQVGAIDPLVFVSAPLLLAVSALAASYLPARRATRVTPVGALRAQ